MKDLLLPRTDGGVLVQAVVIGLIFSFALVGVRRDRELRLLVAGMTVLTGAWFGLRSLH